MMMATPVARITRWLAAAAIALTLAAPGRSADADAGSEDAAIAEAESALAAWDLPAAAAALQQAEAGPLRQVKAGVLAVYEGRYAEAETMLAEVLASGELGDGSDGAEEAKHYLALARGSQRALEGGTMVRSDDGHFEAVFADPKDALLAPYLFEAMASARQALGEDLGLVPSHRVRFEFLDDPSKLAMVTPLTVENIRTTGTVGITKYRRIVMISPRVMLMGYGWLDTAVHEYVHYVLTLRTGNRAPVWLQEGMAKLFETRWRLQTPPPLDPPVAHLLGRAIERDELITFEQMYPSVAMLPSQEQAALAYAEVETMLGLVWERKGTAGIDVLVDRVAAGDDAKEALAAAFGTSFDEFFAEWKKVTRKRTSGAQKGSIVGLKFKDGDGEPDPGLLGDVFSELGGGRARQHARLGALLQARKHLQAAAMQYEKARKADKRARKDPKLSRRLGEVYLGLSDFERAAPLLQIAGKAEPEQPNIAAAEARALVKLDRKAEARAALDRALRQNPFIPTIHCDLAEIAEDEATRKAELEHCRE